MHIYVIKTDIIEAKSCESDGKYNIVWNASPTHCPMVLGKSLDLRWMEKIAGGGVEADDQTM